MAIELPELLVADAAGWRAWLIENHQDSQGVWLVLTKKGGQVTALTMTGALDAALCFGWIDGQVKRRDQGRRCSSASPRAGLKSAWSLRNTVHRGPIDR